MYIHFPLPVGSCEEAGTSAWETERSYGIFLRQNPIPHCFDYF